MTLITRLAISFTDTSLPLLQKDPALPQSGGVMLLDFKNAGSYPSQSTTFSSGQQFPTLVSTNSVTQNYATATSEGTFDPSSGALTGTLNLSPQAGNDFLIDDVSHGYCFSWWLKLPSSVANNVILAQSPTGGNRSFQSRSVNLGSGLTGFTFNHWNAGSSAESYTFTYAGDTVVRIGYAWKWSGSNWQAKHIIDNGSPSAWDDISGLTDPSVGFYNTAQGNPFAIDFGNSSFGGATYRLLIEDITESGRTPEEVWAADWARGNGRYS